MDYYACLGITKQATSSEIKKAYYHCAKKYHPDKNPGDKVAEEKFKACEEAYQVLKDEEKRQLYDLYGKEGLQHQGFNPNDLFNQFNPFFQKQQTNHIKLQLKITLLELYTGCTKTLNFNKQVSCKTCQGKGTTKDIETTCQYCQGRGQSVKMIRQGIMNFQTTQTCHHCRGQGYFIKPEDQCSFCYGNKMIKEKQELKINILPGYQWGQQILSDDIIVTLIPIENIQFKRQQNHLLMIQKINLLQALGGQDIIINHLNGKTLYVSGGVIQPHTIKKLVGYGMPIINTHHYGDLYITFDVIYDLTPEQTNKIIDLYGTKIKKESLKLMDVDHVPQHEDQANVQCAQQ
jgi:DnaJ-class molecular chaperone